MKKILILLVFVFCMGVIIKDASASVVTSFDKRGHSGFPVAIKVLNISGSTTVSGMSVGTTTAGINGVVDQIVVVAPDLSISSVLTITFANEDGSVLYTSSSCTENTTSVIRLTSDTAPRLAGTITVAKNVVGTQDDAVNKTVTLILYYKDEY